MRTLEDPPKACRHVRILLVDDNAAIRQVTRIVLKEAGFEVEEAVDGGDALKKLATGAYDAVVSDLQMPRLDGLSLLREIQRSQMGIPVIIQTASLDVSVATTLRQEGAFRALCKGQFEELLRSLGEALRLSELSHSEPA